jgi:hypothetical protein
MVSVQNCQFRIVDFGLNKLGQHTVVPNLVDSVRSGCLRRRNLVVFVGTFH